MTNLSDLYENNLPRKTVAVGHYSLSADQTTNLTAGNEYIIQPIVDAVASTYAYYTTVLYNVSDSAVIGKQMLSMPEVDASSGNTSIPSNNYVFKPATDIDVEIRCVVMSNVTSIRSDITTLTIIEIQN